MSTTFVCPTIVVTTNGVKLNSVFGFTLIDSVFVVDAPKVSLTVTATLAFSEAVFDSVLLKTTSPLDVKPALPVPEVTDAALMKTLSPSGSIKPLANSTETDCPGRTFAEGAGRSTQGLGASEHQTGAEFPDWANLTVTVAAAFERVPLA